MQFFVIALRWECVYDSVNMEKYVAHISSSFRSWERNGGIPLAECVLQQATEGPLASAGRKQALVGHDSLV